MVTIRLSKQGKRNDHFYRIVAIDKSKKNNGKALEILGFWHPKTGLKSTDKKAIAKWTEKGARLSATVAKILK